MLPQTVVARRVSDILNKEGCEPERVVPDADGGTVFYFFSGPIMEGGSYQRYASITIENEEPGTLVVLTGDRTEPRSHVDEFSSSIEGINAAIAHIQSFFRSAEEL